MGSTFKFYWSGSVFALLTLKGSLKSLDKFYCGSEFNYFYPELSLKRGLKGIRKAEPLSKVVYWYKVWAVDSDTESASSWGLSSSLSRAFLFSTRFLNFNLLTRFFHLFKLFWECLFTGFLIALDLLLV